MKEISTNSSENTWYSILDTVMKLPGVKVNRKNFLSKEFVKYCDDNKIDILIEEGTLKAGISTEIMNKVADGVIGLHTTWVTGTSFVSGIPGGAAILVAIPADLAQYYFHTLVVAQKLAYVYGYPDLDEGVDDDFLMLMTIFMGIMSGVGAASEVLKIISKKLAETAIKKLPQIALTKTAIYPLVKQIAKILGYNITKGTFSKGVGKIIPIIGGLVSAGLTVAMFLPAANKLKNNLCENIIR